MRGFTIIAAFLLVLFSDRASADTRGLDPARDILVTFSNQGLRSFSGGAGEPYRKRKRYSIDPEVRRNAADIAKDYGLVEVDRWPIRSLSVFCFVYRPAADMDRDVFIDRLRTDPRVEFAQPVQRYETLEGTLEGLLAAYDDRYFALQRGFSVMEIPAAHRYSRGRGVRVAIVDGPADTNHEDLRGRLTETRFIGDNGMGNGDHGTAVASVIGANANNAVGIVGVAPESAMELYVACWAEDGRENSVCNSFTLAKALDAVVTSAPDILNLSLTGPADPLLERLLHEVNEEGTVIVAAHPSDHRESAGEPMGFPASLAWVIGVASSDSGTPAVRQVRADGGSSHQVYAPGHQIMVAVPDNAYDFRSGNSLSAAHVSGIVALLIAVFPDAQLDTIQSILRASHRDSPAGLPSINACLVLQLSGQARQCAESRRRGSEQQSGTQHDP